MKKISLLCVVLSFCLYGCGNTDGSLNTSYVTATVDNTLVNSDVTTWVDSTGAKATACSPSLPVTSADIVTATISSKAYSNTGSMASPVKIETATITYSSSDTATPAMATKYQTIGTIIANGGSTTLPVEIVSSYQKQLLQSALACTGTTYNYYVKIVFDVTETVTSKKSTAEVSLQLQLHDYIDK